MKNIVSLEDKLRAKYNKFVAEDSMPTPGTTVPNAQVASTIPATPQQSQQQMAQLKAQQLKTVTDQRKQIQDQIKQKEQELNALRKQLASIRNPGNVTVQVAEHAFRLGDRVKIAEGKETGKIVDFSTEKDIAVVSIAPGVQRSIHWTRLKK